MEITKDELTKLRNAVEAALAWLDKFGEHAPIEFGGEQELHDILQDAVAAEQSARADSACSHPFATYSENIKTCVGCGAVLPQSR